MKYGTREEDSGRDIIGVKRGKTFLVVAILTKCQTKAIGFLSEEHRDHCFLLILKAVFPELKPLRALVSPKVSSSSFT
jgi:hypothetical protein